MNTQSVFFSKWIWNTCMQKCFSKYRSFVYKLCWLQNTECKVKCLHQGCQTSEILLKFWLLSADEATDGRQWGPTVAISSDNGGHLHLSIPYILKICYESHFQCHVSTPQLDVHCIFKFLVQMCWTFINALILEVSSIFCFTFFKHVSEHVYGYP